ncbi:MAG: disulfide bond formation protein B [Proteobacteria bacterium]|nr:disulfide bond formation protein B [Pseudomonadota bacterium]
MRALLLELSRPLVALRLLALAALCSLLFVYIAEYGFDLQPCYLCLWQRGPYFAVLAIAAGVYLRPIEKMIIIALVFAALAVASGLGLAVFHSGVERHWWAGTEQCALRPLNGGTELSLREQLLQTPVARCDQISWSLFGLSMTNYNALLSMGLLGYCLWVLGSWLKSRRNQPSA